MLTMMYIFNQGTQLRVVWSSTQLECQQILPAEAPTCPWCTASNLHFSTQTSAPVQQDMLHPSNSRTGDLKPRPPQQNPTKLPHLRRGVVLDEPPHRHQIMHHPASCHTALLNHRQNKTPATNSHLPWGIVLDEPSHRHQTMHHRPNCHTAIFTPNYRIQ
jgi:hypothetical protein